MKRVFPLVLLFNIVVIGHTYGAANETSPAQEKGKTMKGSHVHLGVKDLPAALSGSTRCGNCAQLIKMSAWPVCRLGNLR